MYFIIFEKDGFIQTKSYIQWLKLLRSIRRLGSQQMFKNYQMTWKSQKHGQTEMI